MSNDEMRISKLGMLRGGGVDAQTSMSEARELGVSVIYDETLMSN